MPWGITVQAVWLLAAAPVLAVATVASARGTVQAADWLGAELVLAISGLVSLAGAIATASVRRRAFEHRMEARRAHVATVAREAELGRFNGQLALVTRTDPLTGLGNRRRLDEELTAAAARATRYGNDCAIGLLNLDGFKAYNDSLGHVAGDAALRAVAAAPLASVRATDTVCRFAGDEFIVVMPGQPLDGATRAIERIRRAVEDLQLCYPMPRGPQLLTISAGIALLGRGAAHDEDEVLRQADAELYRAKGLGRKRAGSLEGASCLRVADVDQDPMDPVVEALGIAEPRELAPGRHEGLLHGIFRPPDVAQDPVRDDEQPVSRAAPLRRASGPCLSLPSLARLWLGRVTHYERGNGAPV